MGVKPVEEEKSFSSVSSRSGRSSNATNQADRQMPSKSDMQKALNDVDDEITGGRIYTSIKVESFDEPKKEIVEENANVRKIRFADKPKVLNWILGPGLL